MDKTEWASESLVFLGMLLNGTTFTLSIPREKRDQALIRKFKDKKKATIKELQQFAGHLNFMNHAVIPACAFTHHMYVKFSGPSLSKLKPHHHIQLDGEFKQDCRIWESFLTNDLIRPFVDSTLPLWQKI